MDVFIFVAIFASLCQEIKGYGPSYGASYNHHNNDQNIEDLVKWWEHEAPDWAKSAEDKVNKPGQFNYYHPHGPGPLPKDSNEDINFRRPGVSRPNQQDDTTDNAQWLRRSFSTPKPNSVKRPSRQSADFGNFQNPSMVTSPTLQACMSSCLSTPEYNPVCGTDNVTYQNQGRLSCARFCGVDVSIRRNSPCPDSFGINEGNTEPRPSTNRPTAVNVFANPNAQSPSLQSCINNCPRRGETALVCGSDGRTYDSPGHLLCAQICGLDVKVQQLSACPGDNNLSTGGTQANVRPNPLSNSGSGSANSIPNNVDTDPSNINSATISSDNRNPGFSFNGNIETTTIPPHLRSCLRSCPTDTVLNPSCGSNRIVYTNPSHLHCARICGVDVQSRPLSFCRPTVNTPTPEPMTNAPNPEPITTQSPLACTRTCKLPADISPVCGTNGVTYKNIDYLQCIKMCGADVELKSNSSCQDESTTKRIQPVAVTPPRTSQVNPNSNQAGVDFTISPDVLNNVFQPTPTGTTTESEIEDSLIRINNK